MPFQLSPGVAVVEKDFSAIVPAVSSSVGAFAGVFAWGPVLDPVTISSENVLVQRFGKPTDANAQSFFTAANFLAYADNLKVVRSVNTSGSNNATSGNTVALIKNRDDWEINWRDGAKASIPAQIKYGSFAARYPATIVNGLKVSVFAGNSSQTLTASSPEWTSWPYSSQYDGPPGTSNYVYNRGGSNDEMHIIVTDPTGTFTGGVANGVLEKFAHVSKAIDAKTLSGETNYYAKVLNRNSAYMYWMSAQGANTDHWGEAATNTFGADVLPYTSSFADGTADNNNITVGNIETGWDLFADADSQDIGLLVTGPAIVGSADATLANYIINNIAEVRKDCVAFVSPSSNSVVNNAGSEATDVLADRAALPSTSYAFMDSSWKYMYDKYNDVYRWVPLNGDTAGLAARTDTTNDPWFSPAGFTRGNIKNVVKLAWNPKQLDRDDLYSKGVNPVVSFPAQGVLLYGDKTLLSRPSAFDRINVRRLFIVLEKTISRYAKSQLFEFNDEYTRSAFRNVVEPFLRDVKARRGVTDYLVVCDSTNNTANVIDQNQFVGDIYVKPTRSINFIQLNFVAVRTGVSFQEVVGAV